MTETNAERLIRLKNINDLKYAVALANPTDDGCHPDAVNIERDIDWLIEQAERAHELEEKNNRLREALEFYADKENYEMEAIIPLNPNAKTLKLSMVDWDCGDKAREALEESE